MSYFIDMKNTSRKPYIYRVTNLETGQYYIGSQCSGKTIGVNYFTSSHNKEFKKEFKTYGEEKYEIVIIKEFDDPDECVRVENYMIRDHMLLKDGLCLNRACHCNGEKIFSRVGLPGWNKGIPRSEEIRKKMRKPHHISPETRVWNKGIPWSDETRKKMDIAHKRIKISIGGTTFDSIRTASKYYNVGTSTIRYWVEKNKHNSFYIEK